MFGCDSAGNLGREESPFWHKRTSISEKMSYFKPKCKTYGFKENTPEMRQCIVNEIRISQKAARDQMNSISTCQTNYSTGRTVCY